MYSRSSRDERFNQVEKDNLPAFLSWTQTGSKEEIEKRLRVEGPDLLIHALENRANKIIDWLADKLHELDALKYSYSDVRSMTPLVAAIRYGNAQTVRKWIEQYKVRVQYKMKENNPLILAASRGNLEIVKCVYSRIDSTLIDNRDGEGYTALLRAVKEGREDVVAFLLENGADPKLIREDKWEHDQDTALSIAAEKGRCGIMKLLMKYIPVRSNLETYLKLLLKTRHDDIKEIIYPEVKLLPQGASSIPQWFLEQNKSNIRNWDEALERERNNMPMHYMQRREILNKVLKSSDTTSITMSYIGNDLGNNYDLFISAQEQSCISQYAQAWAELNSLIVQHNLPIPVPVNVILTRIPSSEDIELIQLKRDVQLLKLKVEVLTQENRDLKTRLPTPNESQTKVENSGLEQRFF
jgi:ankyrin repeat protein